METSALITAAVVLAIVPLYGALAVWARLPDASTIRFSPLVVTSGVILHSLAVRVARILALLGYR